MVAFKTMEVNRKALSVTELHSQTDDEYPFEFNRPVSSSKERLRFRVVCESPTGAKSSTGDLVIGAAGVHE